MEVCGTAFLKKHDMFYDDEYESEDLLGDFEIECAENVPFLREKY